MPQQIEELGQTVAEREAAVAEADAVRAEKREANDAITRDMEGIDTQKKELMNAQRAADRALRAAKQVSHAGTCRQ